MDTQAGLDQRSSEVKYLILLMQGLTDIEGMSMMESNYRTQKKDDYTYKILHASDLGLLHNISRDPL